MKNNNLFICGLILLSLFSCEKKEVIESDNKSSPVYVTCNNNLSDANTINRAIASTSAGDEVVICGQCLINQVIKLLGNRAYSGESLGTVLKQADDANLVALLASDSFLDNTDYTGTPVSIRQLTLDGNKAMNTRVVTAGIILRSWLSTVENMQIINMGGDGLRITSLSSNGTMLNNSQVNGTISGNFISGSNRYGIYVEDTQNSVTDWMLTNNWVANSGSDGIRLDNAAGWIITENHIYGVPNNAIYANRLFGTTISDNYIEGFGETTQSGIWSGIYGTVQGEAASTIDENRIFNFNLDTLNISQSSNLRYIYLTANYDTGLVSLTGNTIRGDGTIYETGLYFTSDPGTWLKVILTGNAIDNVRIKQFVDVNVIIDQ